jgi:hypothetical protein
MNLPALLVLWLKSRARSSVSAVNGPHLCPVTTLRFYDPTWTCLECSVPEPYQSPDSALVPAKIGPKAEYWWWWWWWKKEFYFLVTINSSWDTFKWWTYFLMA